MKNKKRLLLISLVVIVCLCTGYFGFSMLTSNGNENLPVQLDIVQGGTEKIPLEIDSLHTFVGLINGNIIYQTIEDGMTTFHRYEIKSGELTDYADIDNYFLNGKRSTVVNNNLFFYVTVIAKDDTLEDRLYSLDLEDNNLIQVSADERDFHIIPVATLNENVVSLKTDIENDNTGITDIIVYEPTSQNEMEVISKAVDYESVTGEVMINFDVANNMIYIFTEIGNSGDVNSIIEIYDNDFNLVNTISTNGLGSVLETAITDFRVIGDYVFIKNASNEMVLAKIVDDRLEVVLNDSNIDLALYHTDEVLDCYVFYKRQTNEYYILDLDMGLQPITFEIEPDSVVRCVLADTNGVLIVLNEVTEEQNPAQAIYYIDYDSFWTNDMQNAA